MKIKILKIILLIIILNTIFSGCEKKQRSDSNNIYIYTNLINGGTYARINVNTGKITDICADPLCSYDDKDYPFNSGGKTLYYNDNKVYFTVQTESYGDEYSITTSFREYNISTGNIREIYASYDKMRGPYYDFDGGSIYFIAYLYGSDGSTINKWVRVNISNGKSETLKGYFDGFIIGFDNDSIYLYDPLTCSVFSTDKEMKSRTIYTESATRSAIYQCGSLWYSVYNKDANGNVLNRSYAFYRINPSDGNITKICDDLTDTYVDEKQIYYMVTAGNPGIVYTDSSGAVYYNYYDGKIYCMDLDGSNQRLVFDDSKYDITGIRGVAGGKIVCNINQKYVDSLNQYGYGLIGGFLLISNNGTSEVIQYDNREFKVCK